MKAKRYAAFAAAMAVAAAAGFVMLGCGSRSGENDQAAAVEQASAGGHEQHEGEHESAHGGCLNALGTCENGHTEVKVDGDVMKLWFVGGGSDTLKAVRVPDREITLDVALAGQTESRPVVLAAAPEPLAEETVGDCSHFEGRADWLAGAGSFKATGVVAFKGQQQKVVIEYPEGYDPD